MKFKIIAAILMLPTMALAQQPPNQPNEYVLRVKPNDVNVLGKALGKLPFDEVAELMQTLRMQITEQQTPKPTPVPTPGPKKD